MVDWKTGSVKKIYKAWLTKRKKIPDTFISKKRTTQKIDKRESNIGNWDVIWQKRNWKIKKYGEQLKK